MNSTVLKFLFISVLFAIIADSESATVQIAAYTGSSSYGSLKTSKKGNTAFNSCVGKIIREIDVIKVSNMLFSEIYGNRSSPDFLKEYRDCLKKYILDPARKAYEDAKAKKRNDEREIEKAECRKNPPKKTVGRSGNTITKNCETLTWPPYHGSQPFN